MLVLGMLAPGISAALAHTRGDVSAWQDVCRAPSASASTVAEPGGAPLKLMTQGHCAACQLSWTDLATPPRTDLRTVLRTDLGFSVPTRFWSAPRTAHAWVSAPARAPPAQG